MAAREYYLLLAILAALPKSEGLSLSGPARDRETQWLNRYADVVSANVRLGRTKIAFTTINDTLFGLENIITIYLAARLALSNSLTIGMIFADISRLSPDVRFRR